MNAGTIASHAAQPPELVEQLGQARDGYREAARVLARDPLRERPPDRLILEIDKGERIALGVRDLLVTARLGNGCGSGQ